MARLPSFDSQIDKVRADAQKVQELSSRLAEALATLPDAVSENAFAAEAEQMADLRRLKRSLEADLMMFITGFAARTNAAYTAFDRVDDVTRHERFVAFFTRREVGSFKAVRLKKLAIAEGLKAVLFEAAAVCDVPQSCKEKAASLLAASEPKLVASMEARRRVVSFMDEARQRDKALVASFATLQRKIADASDEARLSQLKAEEVDTVAQREGVLKERKRLGREHDVLDRQAILLGDLIDLLNDDISLHTLLLNRLDIEAERGIQLYDAAFGSLDPLLAEAEPHSPLGVFHELMTLHRQGAVTMQDIERRKNRADAALQRRRENATGTVV